MSRVKCLTLGMVVTTISVILWAAWYLFSPLDGFEVRMARQQSAFLAERCHVFHRVHGRYPTELRELVVAENGRPVLDGGEAVITPTPWGARPGYALHLDGKAGPFVWHDIELPQQSFRIGVRLLPDGTTVPFDDR